MSKRRGVVISTNQAPSIAKSKSANINPQLSQAQSHPLAYQIEPAMYQSGEIQPMADEEMIESNFISQQAPREVNLKHYAYNDPDNPYDTIENKYEDNEEDIIVSMHKKKEMIQAMKKEETMKKVATKKKVVNLPPSREKRMNRTKQSQVATLARVAQNRSQTNKNFKSMNKGSRQKCTRENRRQGEPQHTEHQLLLKKSIDNQKLKPRPLDFTVDMFDRKAMYSPHKRKRDDFSSNYRAIERAQTENIPQKTCPQATKDSEGDIASGVNENLNSRKLPFRLCAFG